MPYLPRKYVDLIREATLKWVNLDPPIPVEVGAYGTVERETGGLRVEGNIYHPEFQNELNRLGLNLRVADHQPQDSGVEEDYIVTSRGVTRVDWNLGPGVGVAGLANASIKGRWQFERGKRDAILIMHRPRMKFLPSNVILDTLYRVPKLKDKLIVTNVHICPAYSFYLSNKSGEKASLALVAEVPIAGIAGVTATANGGFDWWSDAQADFYRRACDKTGNYCFTPLYTMKRRIGLAERLFREDGTLEPPPSGDDLWGDVPTPWDPLNEEGEEDSIDVQGEEDNS